MQPPDRYCVRISHTLKSTKRTADLATKPKEEEEKTQSGAGVITSSGRLRQTRHHSYKEKNGT